MVSLIVSRENINERVHRKICGVFNTTLEFDLLSYSLVLFHILGIISSVKEIIIPRWITCNLLLFVVFRYCYVAAC